jgi:hypothetical protein
VTTTENAATRVYDPGSGLNLQPHHEPPGKQCAARDSSFYCTVKAGPHGWHVAWGREPRKPLHIWLNADVWLDT